MSADYDLYSLHTQSEPQAPSKYFGLSIVLHSALAIGALFVTIPALENLKKEVVTIEIQEPEQTIPPMPVKPLAATPLGEEVPRTRGSEAAPAVAATQSPAPAAPIESELAEKVQAPVAKTKKSVSPKAAMKTHTGGAAKPVAIAKTAPARAGVPESIEDIAAPDLDFDGVVASQPGKLGDDELEDNFKNIDKSNAAAIQEQKAELDDELKQVSDEKDLALQALEDDNKAQARAMEDALEAKRTKNAAAVAQLKAAEQAAKEKAARENELAHQKAKAAALAASTAAAASSAKGQGPSESSGHGAGSAGENSPSTQASGDPNGVRSLDELRQMPGNPKPQYSVDERLQRQQGVVAFHAYISKAGIPSQFKITQSTGYRNLDGKTLAALKKWKFYPGQEGWVEIPFKWDIKGGVQEVPTLLRRARYGSN